MSIRLATALLAGVCLSALALTPVVLLPSQIVDLYRPSYQLPFEPSTPIAQTFVSPTDRLSSVGFFITFRDSRSARVDVQISDETTGAILGVSSRTLRGGTRIPSDVLRPQYFDFTPVPHSANMLVRATVRVSSPGVAVWMAGTDVYPGGRAYLDVNPQTFDFAFITRHHGTPAERLGRLSEWAPLWLVLAAAVGALTFAMAAGLVASRRVRPILSP